MAYNFNAAEVFKIAIQIEENGKQFYEQGQKIIGDAGVKNLFTELAKQEVEHKKKFESLREQLPAGAAAPTVWDPDNELDQYLKMMADQHVFISGESVEAKLAEVKDARSALKMAMDFEKDSVIFFLTLEDATEGKQSQDFIRSLVKEEQEHLRRLSLELRRISR